MSEFKYPPVAEDAETVLETDFMRQVENRTLDVHRGSALVVWTGRQRIGKTTTALWMRDRINDAYGENPAAAEAFRALYYEVGEIPRSASRPQKAALRGVYNACIGPLDEGLYRRPPEVVASLVVQALAKREYEMVMVDEAGLLTVKALRGLVLARDTAKNEGHTLTIVFIGMDDLPSMIESNPQMEGRVHEWIGFVPYELDDTRDLILELDPAFLRRAPDDGEAEDVVRWIHNTFGGIPGEVVPFVRRVRARVRRMDRKLDVSLCKAVHRILVRDRERTTKLAQEGWSDDAVDS